MTVAAKFSVGQIVEHRKFGYRGAIYGVDAEYSQSEEWYQQVALSRPPRDKPWYCVLVDGSPHTTYVAERHLAASRDCGQINHPLLGRYFGSYDGRQYYPRTARVP